MMPEGCDGRAERSARGRTDAISGAGHGRTWLQTFRKEKQLRKTLKSPRSPTDTHFGLSRQRGALSLREGDKT
jgi:hypothetical protein